MAVCRRRKRRAPPPSPVTAERHAADQPIPFHKLNLARARDGGIAAGVA